VQPGQFGEYRNPLNLAHIQSVFALITWTS
jgi:hypothetical protein